MPPLCQHLLPVQMNTMMSELLQSTLRSSKQLTDDEKDRYSDELIGCLSWIWQWFVDARCSPLLYSEAFLTGTNVLYRLASHGMKLEDFSLSCCWFYPWVQLLKGDEAEDTQAALQAIKHASKLKGFSPSVANANELLRDTLKGKGNEIFAKGEEDQGKCAMCSWACHCTPDPRATSLPQANATVTATLSPSATPYPAPHCGVAGCR